VKPRALLLSGLLVAFTPLLHTASAWRPITPNDTAAQPPASEANVNGLTLLRDIAVDCSDLRRTVSAYYIRAKVLNAAGIDALNKTEITFARDTPVTDLAARVVKPDGRVIPVASTAIFTREIIKAGGESVSVKAFSFAGLEPGDIAEYQYRTTSPELTLGVRFFLNDDFPTVLTRIRIGAVSYPGLHLQVLSPQELGFKLTSAKGDKELIYEARDIPSTKAESFPPPEDQAKPWFIYYYTFLGGADKDYWGKTSDSLAELARTYCAQKPRIKEKATALVLGATSDEDAIRRIYEFCRTGIKNLSYEASGYSSEQIDALKPNKTATDILANGYGTATEINLLFVALLRASGRDCTPAYCADRSQSFFNRAITTRASLPHLVVAVGPSPWTFYDPGSRFLPPGKLDWKNERTTALVPTGKKWEFVETSQSPAPYSTTRRSAKLSITPDGALEGDLAWSISGHGAFEANHRFSPKTPTERSTLVAEELKSRLPGAEVTDCKIHLTDDLSAPPEITCHIRVPDYATNIGDRLLLQLAFFQKGLVDPFAASSRKTNVYFPYFVSEIDQITLTLPEGYELEPPKPFEDVGGGDMVHYSAELSLQDNDRSIFFERKFTRKLFINPVENYPVLRGVHERIFEQDGRVSSLRSTTTSSEAATNGHPPNAPGQP
jgi:hypothetical protein